MSYEIKAPAIAYKLVGLIRSKPWLTLLLGFVVLGALAPGMARITADFTHRGFFWDDDPMMLAFDRFERQFGNDDSVIVAIHSPSGIFDPESIALLQKITERMWRVPEVIRVDSVTNYNWIHAEGDELIVEPLIPDDQELTDEIIAERKAVALSHEVVPDYLVSKDGKTAIVFGAIKPGIDAPPDAPLIVGAVREMVKELQSGDHEMHISGGPAVNLGFAEASQTDLATLVPIVLLLTIILLGFTLRSVVGVLLSLVVVITSIIGSLAVGGWIGIQMSNVTSVLPQILLAIAVADSVHILVTFLRRMARGMSQKDAAEYSLVKNFMPTVITTITTSVGFLSFATANLKPISGLGTLAGIGTFIAWLFTYLLLGSLIFIIPIKRKELPPEQKEVAEGRAHRYIERLAQYQYLVFGAFAIICVSAVVLAFQNSVNSDPFKYFREGFPLRVANEFIEDKVGGARGVEVVIDSGAEEGVKAPEFLAKVETLQNWIDEIPQVTRTISIVDILKQTNRSLNGDDQSFYRLPEGQEIVAQELFLYQMSLPQGMNLNDRITVKNDALRLTVLWTIPTSAEAVAVIERIENKGEELGLNASVTGKNRLYQSMNGYVVESFIVSLGAAVLLISLILVVFFRSPKLGLLAMIPNAVPLIIGGGLLTLMEKPLDIGTVLIMAVCLGIAVDDTIHVMSNYGRLTQAEGRSRKEAVEDVLAHTSPALMVTTLILVIAFGTFWFGTFTPNVYFGGMTALILGVALFTDLSLLPAVLLGRHKGERSAPEAESKPA